MSEDLIIPRNYTPHHELYASLGIQTQAPSSLQKATSLNSEIHEKSTKNINFDEKNGKDNLKKKFGVNRLFKTELDDSLFRKDENINEVSYSLSNICTNYK